ncbi:hypothetical protein Tco_0226589 [Tanacetum coccineum]
MDLVTLCTTLPSHSRSLNRLLFHFSRRLQAFLSTSSLRVDPHGFEGIHKDGHGVRMRHSDKDGDEGRRSKNGYRLANVLRRDTCVQRSKKIYDKEEVRYVDTKPNGASLNKCILQGPYVLSNIILPEYKAHYDVETEAIHLILTGIRDDIYSTIDTCKTTYDMWIAIERLQQGESLNKQDVKTSLFWECGRFTSRDGESIESYHFRHKGKEIAKPITPPSESASKEDIDPEQTRRDKDMEKNLALIAKNKNVDTTPRYMNDNQTGQFGNQMIVTVVKARDTIGSQECMKPKWAKDYTYHKEKMLLCKQAEKGVLLQAEQSDLLEDTNKEIDEQELEAHYSFMAKIQEVLPADSGKVERDNSNVIPDSSNMCDNDNQADRNATECDDKRVALANLITNLTLDIEENKKIQKQLKKANASLAQGVYKDTK